MPNRPNACQIYSFNTRSLGCGVGVLKGALGLEEKANALEQKNLLSLPQVQNVGSYLFYFCCDYSRALFFYLLCNHTELICYLPGAE